VIDSDNLTLKEPIGEGKIAAMYVYWLEVASLVEILKYYFIQCIAI